jgi:uncharacterized membrane protein YheB (UPF0754 family)
LPRLLKVFSRREDFLEAQINQIFEKVLLDFQLSEVQSRQFVDWLLERILPTDILRLALIDFLTDRNIQVIDEGFREKTSGTYWVVANLFGVRNTLVRLRSFCIEEKEVANTRLKELMLSLEVRGRLRNWLHHLSLQNLPLSTVNQLRKTTGEAVRAYIRESGANFLEDFGESIDWDNLAIVIVNRLQNSSALTGSFPIPILLDILDLFALSYVNRFFGTSLITLSWNLDTSVYCGGSSIAFCSANTNLS